MADGECPRPGGWSRIHLIVDDLASEVARLRTVGVQFRNDIVTGPGGSQILLKDPSGNLVELFQPAHRWGAFHGFEDMPNPPNYPRWAGVSTSLANQQPVTLSSKCGSIFTPYSSARKL
jgi:hypothetical protein